MKGCCGNGSHWCKGANVFHWFNMCKFFVSLNVRWKQVKYIVVIGLYLIMRYYWFANKVSCILMVVTMFFLIVFSSKQRIIGTSFSIIWGRSMKRWWVGKVQEKEILKGGWKCERKGNIERFGRFYKLFSSQHHSHVAPLSFESSYDSSFSSCLDLYVNLYHWTSSLILIYGCKFN